MAAVTDARCRGVGTSEKALGFWAGILFVHENRFGPALTGAKNIALGKASAGFDADEI